MTRRPTSHSENLRATTAHVKAHFDEREAAHIDGTAHSIDGPVGCPPCAALRKEWVKHR
jgi:hypothetical protein